MIWRLFSLRRGAVLGIVAVGAAIALFGGSRAEARSEIAPYIEVQQVLEAELDGGGDVLTYTAVAAGVDARVKSRRVTAQISYRYERRIPWKDNIIDEDVHSGLAQVRLEVAPRALSIDAGAIAARSRQDPRGPAFGFSGADNPNIAQIYGVYAGPTLATHAGPIAVNASYRLGYVKVDDHSLAGSDFPGGPLDRYESSTSHTINASVGMGPGALPFGWTVGAGYERETTKRLDQRYIGKYVRGDVVLPVSSTFAITGGIGYEKIRASQDDFLRDAAGLPVVTPGGNLVADKSKPRLLAYDQSGLIWDAGVIWRPSPRTELTGRVGERYGGTTVVGTLKYQINRNFAFSAFVYDGVTSFGRLLISDVSGLPAEFQVNNHGLNASLNGLGGCVVGKDPGTGACLNDAFQSVSSSTFRNRGVGLLLSGGRGPWDLHIGAGYARRKYLTPAGSVFLLHNVVDESAMIEAGLGRRLTRSSGLNFDAYASWFDTGIPGNGTVFSGGVTGTYYHRFLVDRLQGQTSVGIYTTDAGIDDGTSTVAAAMLGLRYTF